MKYDIIGDIHGCAKSLISLLVKLGYQKKNGIYQQQGYKVIFLGDFIDRGPYQSEVINIVRPMIDNDYALSVMGNHEYNAITYASVDAENKDYLRKHNVKNDRQHKAFLAAYPFNSTDYHEVIEWFKTLPLWLELDSLRVVHACWDFNCIQKLEKETTHQLLNAHLLNESSNEGTWQFDAIETLLKGKELPLPEGSKGFKDKDGNPRHNIRIQWWDKNVSTYHDAFIGPESAKSHIPKDKINGDHLIDYHHDDKPVFLGHYWLEGEIKSLASNIACLDYSVAKPEGNARLVAYRFEGEQTLTNSHFIWVNRQEN